MSGRGCRGLGVGVLLLLNAAHGAVSGEEALQDWRELVEVYYDVEDRLREYADGFIHARDTAEYARALVEFTRFEREDLPRVAAILDRYRARYGTRAKAIDEAMRELVSERPLGLRGAGATFEEMERGYKGASAVRTNMGAALLEKAQAELKLLRVLPEELRLERYEEIKQLLQIGAQFDPQNQAITARLGSIEKEKAEAVTVLERERDARRWPGDFSGFRGPGDVAELLAAVRKLLEGAPEWGGDTNDGLEVVAIALRGNWWSVEKNVLGQTTKWGLPVYVATASAKEDPRNVRVYELVAYTAGAEAAPPFTGVTVGESWVMRRAHVPSGCGGWRGGWGVVGRVIWLLLGVSNVLVGIAGAAPLLRERAPHVGWGWGVLERRRVFLGIVATMVALVAFVRNLFLLRLLSDLVPIVTGLATGLVLGRPMLQQVVAMRGLNKVAGAYEGLAEPLAGIQVPLGIASVLAGVLHLVVGSWWLL
ncbi:MAG: hypothetical protein N2595_00445 [bacterium]|nr:hypothetical protein [bacterium]